MTNPEYFKMQAKNLFEVYKKKDKDSTMTLMKAQHEVAVLAGFKKWTDLSKASDSELDIARNLLADKLDDLRGEYLEQICSDEGFVVEWLSDGRVAVFTEPDRDATIYDIEGAIKFVEELIRKEQSEKPSKEKNLGNKNLTLKYGEVICHVCDKIIDVKDAAVIRCDYIECKDCLPTNTGNARCYVSCLLKDGVSIIKSDAFAGLKGEGLSYADAVEIFEREKKSKKYNCIEIREMSVHPQKVIMSWTCYADEIKLTRIGGIKAEAIRDVNINGIEAQVFVWKGDDAYFTDYSSEGLGRTIGVFDKREDAILAMNNFDGFKD